MIEDSAIGDEARLFVATRYGKGRLQVRVGLEKMWYQGSESRWVALRRAARRVHKGSGEAGEACLSIAEGVWE